MTGELRIEYLPLSKLEKWPNNPKAHDEEGIETSISRFGFAQPPTVDETTGRLVAGHGRVNVLVKMRAAGEPPPRGIQKKGKDWLIPVVRGLAFESETEAEAYLLADNALNIKAGWDKKLLAQMVRRLEKRKVPLTDLGWHRKELDEIMGRILSKAPPTIEIQEQWLVLVTCKNEKDQAKMLERLTKDGYEVRALTS